MTMQSDDEILKQLELAKSKFLAEDPTAKADGAPTALPAGVKASSRAVPPIKAAEVATAINAVCPWHGGDILRIWKPHLDEMHGRVYFCKVGKAYWRLHHPGRKGLDLPPIAYPRRRVV